MTVVAEPDILLERLAKTNRLLKQSSDAIIYLNNIVKLYHEAIDPFDCEPVVLAQWKKLDKELHPEQGNHMTEACQNCGFFYRLCDTDGNGWCRRNPPPFPDVGKLAWCGEYVQLRTLQKERPDLPHNELEKAVGSRTR